MADNTTRNATAGGDTIRALDRSSVKTPIDGLDIAQSGESELLGLGDSRIISATSAGLTTASTNYTSGDQLGTELSFSSIVRTGKGATIQSATLIDKAKVTSLVDLFLFQASTTPASDNAANSWSDADMLNCIGVLHFTDAIVSANNHVVLATNTPITIKPSSGTTIYGNLVARAATNFFGAVGDVVVNLGLIRD